MKTFTLEQQQTLLGMILSPGAAIHPKDARKTAELIETLEENIKELSKPTLMEKVS